MNIKEFTSKRIQNEQFEKIGTAIFVFLVTFFVFLPFSLIGIDAHHDGIMLKPALDVLAGQTLFRDSFEQYGALTTYLQACFLWLFGPTLKVLKISTVFIYSCASTVLFLTWREFLPLSLSVLAFLIWLISAPFLTPEWVFLPWSSVYALFFQALAIYFLTLTFTRNRPKLYSSISGLMCASVFLCRQPVGIFAAIAVFGSLFLASFFSYFQKPKWRVPLSFALSFGGLLLLFFLELILTHSFQEWRFQTLIYPAEWLRRIEAKTFPRIMASLLLGWDIAGNKILVFLALFCLPGIINLLSHVKIKKELIFGYYFLLALGYGYWWPNHFEYAHFIGGWSTAIPLGFIGYLAIQGIIFLQSRKELDSISFAGVAAIIVCLSSWSQYFPVTCSRHVYWAISPSIGFLLYVLLKLSQRRAWMLMIMLLAFWIPTVMKVSHLAQAKLNSEYAMIQGSSVLVGMKVPVKEKKDWEELITKIQYVAQSAGNRPILVEGVDALYAALVQNRKNPGPYYVEWLYRDLTGVRASFISENQPFIFIHHFGHRPFVEEAIKKFNYESVLKNRLGELLVPKPIGATGHST